MNSEQRTYSPKIKRVQRAGTRKNCDFSISQQGLFGRLLLMSLRATLWGGFFAISKNGQGMYIMD